MFPLHAFDVIYCYKQLLRWNFPYYDHILVPRTNTMEIRADLSFQDKCGIMSHEMSQWYEAWVVFY